MGLDLDVPNRLPEFNVAAILETVDATEGGLGVGFHAGRNFLWRNSRMTSLHFIPQEHDVFRRKVECVIGSDGEGLPGPDIPQLNRALSGIATHDAA